MYQKIFLGLFVFSFMQAVGSVNGACRYESGTPGLPTAICTVPECPTGADCTPPAIQTGSANIRFEEPLYRWVNSCPEEAGSGYCWEVFVNAEFEIGVSDPSGIKAIGINLAKEVSARRKFQKYWTPSVSLTGVPGRYRGSLKIFTHVLAGKSFELSVYQVCAKDHRDNETCIMPLGS